MQKEIKIELDFNNKYYYGINFHNNKLKYLTVNDLVYIFKDLMSFYGKKGLKEPIKVDENYNEYYTLDRADWFDYNNDLKYKIYKIDLYSPSVDLIPELLKAISVELSKWGSQETHLSMESLLKIAKYLTLNQFLELLNHVAYPYYISYVCESECWFGFIEIKNSVTIEPRTIVRMVENGELFLEPEYQRGFIWTQEHKEEFLLDWINGKVIVTPYLVSYYKEDKHVYEVLDGKQRLQTVYEFLSNKITVNNLYYKDLLEYEKMAIIHKQITGLLLTQTSGDGAYTRPDLKILAQTFLNFNKGITVDEEVLNQAKTFL